jgi:hypothetical protein
MNRASTTTDATDCSPRSCIRSDDRFSLGLGMSSARRCVPLSGCLTAMVNAGAHTDHLPGGGRAPCSFRRVLTALLALTVISLAPNSSYFPSLFLELRAEGLKIIAPGSGTCGPFGCSGSGGLTSGLGSGNLLPGLPGGGGLGSSGTCGPLGCPGRPGPAGGSGGIWGPGGNTGSCGLGGGCGGGTGGGLGGLGGGQPGGGILGGLGGGGLGGAGGGLLGGAGGLGGLARGPMRLIAFFRQASQLKLLSGLTRGSSGVMSGVMGSALQLDRAASRQGGACGGQSCGSARGSQPGGCSGGVCGVAPSQPGAGSCSGSSCSLGQGPAPSSGRPSVGSGRPAAPLFPGFPGGGQGGCASGFCPYQKRADPMIESF